MVWPVSTNTPVSQPLSQSRAFTSASSPAFLVAPAAWIASFSGLALCFFREDEDSFDEELSGSGAEGRLDGCCACRLALIASSRHVHTSTRTSKPRRFPKTTPPSTDTTRLCFCPRPEEPLNFLRCHRSTTALPDRV